MDDVEARMARMRKAFKGALDQGLEAPTAENAHMAVRLALEEIRRANPKAPLRTDGDPFAAGLVLDAEGVPLLKVRCMQGGYQVSSAVGTKAAYGEEGLVAAVSDVLRASAKEISKMPSRQGRM